jgi:uncharacterized membrane protein YhaH (DUF805 family)
MQWFVMGMKNFLQFGGRSRRSEYWYFALFYILILFVLAFIDVSFGWVRNGSGIGPLSGLFALIVFLPNLALSIRRLHDTGRSGWWILIGFVPIVGVIALIVLYATEGEAGTNAYGPNPKEPVHNKFEFPKPINS